MKLPRHIVLGVIALGVISAIARPQPAHAGIDWCQDQANNCKSYHYIPATDDTAHNCPLSGLTMQCVDIDWQVCDTSTDKGPAPCYAAMTDGGTAHITRQVSGLYQIGDFVRQFFVISQWGLGFVVFLAVLMFIWAGWKFLTAAGRSNMIEDGKKIIGGTIVGLVISFGAFVIINFAVIALTGASIKTSDIFAGPVGLLFPGLAEQQPFSGSTAVESRPSTDCRSPNNAVWDKDCTDHVYCADTGTGTNGIIGTIQKKLNALKCGCGAVSGCYAATTVDCVRKFQLANNLPASGVFDATTSARLEDEDPTPAACDSTVYNDAAGVMSHLPAAVLPTESEITHSETLGIGCCVVARKSSESDSDAYCLPGVTDLTCATLNGGSATSWDGSHFYAGSACEGSQTNYRCGFCYSAGAGLSDPGSYKAFQYATPDWCSNIATDSAGGPLVFQVSTCDPYYGGRCIDTLSLHPPK